MAITSFSAIQKYRYVGGISNLNAQVHRLPSQQDFFQQKATVLVSHGWKTAPSGSPVERLVGQLSLLCSTPDKK
jgi:hypothetical protein